jgi:hypothetical protein
MSANPTLARSRWLRTWLGHHAASASSRERPMPSMLNICVGFAGEGLEAVGCQSAGTTCVIIIPGWQLTQLRKGVSKGGKCQVLVWLCWARALYDSHRSIELSCRRRERWRRMMTLRQSGDRMHFCTAGSQTRRHPVQVYQTFEEMGYVDLRFIGQTKYFSCHRLMGGRLTASGRPNERLLP